jgi:hypothetical protein
VHTWLELTSKAVEGAVGHYRNPIPAQHQAAHWASRQSLILLRPATPKSPHLVGRTYSQHGEPASKHRNHALYEPKAGQGQFWIILHNEA